MKTPAVAGLVSLAACAAQAQTPFALNPPLVVTASRGLEAMPTLRDATVITREDIEASGALSLGEVLQRREIGRAHV